MQHNVQKVFNFKLDFRSKPRWRWPPSWNQVDSCNCGTVEAIINKFKGDIVEFMFPVGPEMLGEADVLDVGLRPRPLSTILFIDDSSFLRVVRWVGEVVLTSRLCVGLVPSQLDTPLKPLS